MAIKLTALTKFPARVIATAGVAVRKVSGVYTFVLDLLSFAPIASLDETPNGYIFLITDNGDGTASYSRIPTSSFSQAEYSADVAAWLNDPTSANLRTALTDETGTGAAVFAGSPALTGIPTAPTAGPATNTTQLATTAFVTSAVDAITPPSYGAGVDDFLIAPLSANLNTAVTDSTGTDALVFANSPALTGAPTAPTAAPGTNDTTIASTAFVANTFSSVSPTSIPPSGRLTLTSGAPVMGSSVSGATTIYYTPSTGNQIPLYNGTIVPTTFAELSQTTTDTTKSPAAVAADKNYDLFVWNDGGTIRLSRGPDWSAGAVAGSNAYGSSARGTGAGSTELIWVNGLALNKNAITNGPAAQRGTYVGSVRSNASSTIDYILGGAASGGLGAKLNVWNAYNQEEVNVLIINTVAGYSLSGATAWRVAGASAGMTAYFLQGLAGKTVEVDYSDLVTPAAVAGAFAQLGVYRNAGSGTPPVRTFYQTPAVYANLSYQTTPPSPWVAPLGANYVAAAEAPDGTNAASFNFWGATNFMGLRLRMWM